MINDHLRSIRKYELGRTVGLLPGQGSVLEVGAGAGWQAQELSELGFQVTAIDVPDSNYANQMVIPVMQYDGHNIPFADETFDVVFSSNVLEHVPNISEFSTELRRVLKSDGRAVHILPTPTWRLWTTLTHYVAALKSRSLIRLVYQRRHGERGMLLTEPYFFSRFYWRKLFGATGWRVVDIIPNRLFYTGYSILDARLSLERRQRLSSLLGSACAIYLLEKSEALEI